MQEVPGSRKLPRLTPAQPVVAKGYLTKLLFNRMVKSCVCCYEPEILIHMNSAVNIVSMEEAVQQQRKAEV